MRGAAAIDPRRRGFGGREGGSNGADHAAQTGRADPLLAETPARFFAQLGHNDHVEKLPDGVVSLASSHRCRHQLIRATGKPAYGSQFHCELNRPAMEERLHVYGDEYLKSEEEWHRFRVSLRETPDVERLFKRFLKLYT